MPGASHEKAKRVPNMNCERLLVGRVDANKATPKYASGHHPHGGRLKATSKPATTAVAVDLFISDALIVTTLKQ
jgi:hypothetical protein